MKVAKSLVSGIMWESQLFNYISSGYEEKLVC